MPFKTPNKTSGYIRSLLKSEEDGILNQIEFYASQNFIPVLLPETAAFLKQLVLLKKPRKILEIGTAIGYSGLLMLLYAKSAHLTTVELDENYARIAKEYFTSANQNGRATVFVGDAGEIIPLLEGEFDFIFLDGPKARYYEFLPYLKRRLCAGGILLCDNVLYNGMVSGEENAGKKAGLVKKLQMFLEAVSEDNDFLTSILPVGDGLSLSILKDERLFSHLFVPSFSDRTEK